MGNLSNNAPYSGKKVSKYNALPIIDLAVTQMPGVNSP